MKQGQIPDLKFHKICVCEEHQKCQKALAILSNATVRRFLVTQEGLKVYWKSEKMAAHLKVTNRHIIFRLFKGFTNAERTGP